MAATLKDIAQRTGVSIAAVSMALKDHPRIGVTRRKAIQAVAREMGYEPDMAAQAVRSQRSHTIGLLMSNFRVSASGFRTDIIEREIARHGYRVQIGFTQSETARLIQQIRLMRASRVEGLVVHGLFPRKDMAGIYEELERCQFPVALVDGWLSAPASDQFPHVGIDRAQAMRRLVKHLVDTGRRDLLFFGSELGGTNGEKFRGVLEACRMHRVRLRYASVLDGSRWIDGDQVLVQDIPRSTRLYPNGFMSPRALNAVGRQAVRRIAGWKDLPDALLATNDELAMIAVAGLQKHRGLRVPQDIAVTGYDDITTARLFIPPLTSVREPRKTMARRLSSMLLALLNNQPLATRMLTLAPSPVIRHSSQPA